MGIGRFISIPTFLISFAIGIIIVNLTTIPKRNIYVYPTIDNAKKLLYKDQAEQCFEFSHNEIPCPADKSKIKEIPIQNPKPCL
jgi:hypothetical protein